MLDSRAVCRILGIFVFIVGIVACNPHKEATVGWKLQKHSAGPGPEDVEIDLIHDRLLISCSARREKEDFFGEIIALYKNEGKVTVDTLAREGEPSGLIFQPHGISLVQDVRGQQHLYIVNHEDDVPKQSILKYEVKPDRLIFKEQFTDPLLVSPNSVLGQPNGSFYTTNDASKRGSRFQALFKVKGASVLYYDGKGNWKTVHKRLSYANGLARRNDSLFLTSTRQHQLRILRVEDEGDLTLLSTVKGIKGADNIRFDGKYLLIPGHPKILKFVKHVGNPNKKSPSLVYRVDPQSLELEEFFYDPGEGISAGSSALPWKGSYWLVQVLDPFVAELNKP